MSDQTLKLIEAATYLAFFFIGLAITIWVKPWIAAHTSVEKTNFLYNMADTLVKAAEQLQGPGTGPSKFDYVFSALHGLADSHGINASTETIVAAIEAAVHEMNAGQASAQAPAAAAVGNVVVAAPAAVTPGINSIGG